MSIHDKPTYKQLLKKHQHWLNRKRRYHNPIGHPEAYKKVIEDNKRLLGLDHPQPKSDSKLQRLLRFAKNSRWSKVKGKVTLPKLTFMK